MKIALCCAVKNETHERRDIEPTETSLKRSPSSPGESVPSPEAIVSKPPSAEEAKPCAPTEKSPPSNPNFVSSSEPISSKLPDADGAKSAALTEKALPDDPNVAPFSEPGADKLPGAEEAKSSVLTEKAPPSNSNLAPQTSPPPRHNQFRGMLPYALLPDPPEPDSSFCDRLIVLAPVLVGIRLLETWGKRVGRRPRRLQELAFDRCNWSLHPTLSWADVVGVIERERVRLCHAVAIVFRLFIPRFFFFLMAGQPRFIAVAILCSSQS